jgi:hypothetical protein
MFFTMAGASSLVFEYRRHGFADQKRLLIESAFTLICAYFTLQSFLKAKRTAKRK